MVSGATLDPCQPGNQTALRPRLGRRRRVAAHRPVPRVRGQRARARAGRADEGRGRADRSSHRSTRGPRRPCRRPKRIRGPRVLLARAAARDRAEARSQRTGAVRRRPRRNGAQRRKGSAYQTTGGITVRVSDATGRDYDNVYIDNIHDAISRGRRVGDPRSVTVAVDL